MVLMVMMAPKIIANDASSRVELVFKGKEQVQEGAHAAAVTGQELATAHSIVPPDCTVTNCSMVRTFRVVVFN
jgi:hypothetical protein